MSRISYFQIPAPLLYYCKNLEQVRRALKLFNSNSENQYSENREFGNVLIRMYTNECLSHGYTIFKIIID